jgi:hypothetical protein
VKFHKHPAQPGLLWSSFGNIEREQAERTFPEAILYLNSGDLPIGFYALATGELRRAIEITR